MLQHLIWCLLTNGRIAAANGDAATSHALLLEAEKRAVSAEQPQPGDLGATIAIDEARRRLAEWAKKYSPAEARAWERSADSLWINYPVTNDYVELRRKALTKTQSRLVNSSGSNTRPSR